MKIYIDFDGVILDTDTTIDNIRLVRKLKI